MVSLLPFPVILVQPIHLYYFFFLCCIIFFQVISFVIQASYFCSSCYFYIIFQRSESHISPPFIISSLRIKVVSFDFLLMEVSYFPHPLFPLSMLTHVFTLPENIFVQYSSICSTLILVLDVKLNILNAHHQSFSWMKLNLQYTPHKIGFCIWYKYTFFSNRCASDSAPFFFLRLSFFQ